MTTETSNKNTDFDLQLREGRPGASQKQRETSIRQSSA